MEATVTAVPVEATAPPDPASSSGLRGVKNYEKHCAKCHGPAGAGDGAAAKLLKPKPTDFTDAKVQAGRTDGQLLDATMNGAKALSVKVGKKMPAYAKKLSEAEIKELVAVLRSFKK